MEFEWDPKKNAANLAKHGFDFADASHIFDGPVALFLSPRPEVGEERWVAIGRLEEVVVTIICTLRGQKIRIISARRASGQERDRYEAEIAHGLETGSEDDAG
jgi:uncharacterized protein